LGQNHFRAESPHYGNAIDSDSSSNNGGKSDHARVGSDKGDKFPDDEPASKRKRMALGKTIEDIAPEQELSKEPAKKPAGTTIWGKLQAR